jgi:hypothetical protein
MYKNANFPSSLFIDSPEMQDASRHQLSNDIESWPEEILQRLRERVPRSASMNSMVKFMNKDPENGAATGSITVNTAEKSAIVPFVIKDFALYPLDVVITRGRLLPLNPTYFDQIFDENQIFDKLEEFPSLGGLSRFEDANLWNAIYPPSLGRYAYASAGYPILDAISDNVDGTSLKETIEADPSIAVGFSKHGHTEVVKKLAHLRPVNINEYRQTIDNLIPRNFMMIKAEGPNKYTLLSNPDKTFNPMVKSVDYDKLCSMIATITTDPQDWVNDVDQNGTKVLNTPVHDESILAIPEDEMPEEAKEYGYFAVRNQRGVTFNGVVIPTVIDLDQNPLDEKMFLSPDMGTIQPVIWGVRAQNSHYNPVEASKGCCPSVGQTGTFVLLSEKNFTGLATTPLTVKTCVEDPCGRKKYVMTDAMGRDVKVKIAGGMSVKRIAFDGECYYIPERMVWVPMSGFDQLDSNRLSYASKTAAAKFAGKNHVRLIKVAGLRFSAQGLDKYANEMGWDKTYLRPYQVNFLLGSCGVGQEKIGKLMLRAHETGEASIHNVNLKPLLSEKEAGYRKVAEKFVKQAKDLRRNLIKEASTLDNTQTVDTILSLNFITPQTLQKFVAKIPQLKSSLSTLCSLALASRLGLDDVAEGSVTTCMQELVNVIEGLENIRAQQEIKK